MADTIAQYASQLEGFGPDGKLAANVWLALWSRASGRGVLRASWGVLRLPRIVGGATPRVAGMIGDATALVVRMNLAAERDPAAAATATEDLKRLMPQIRAHGWVTLVAGIIGLVSAVVSGAAGAYQADKQEKAAVAQSQAAAREAAAREVEAKARASIEAKKAAAAADEKKRNTWILAGVVVGGLALIWSLGRGK